MDEARWVDARGQEVDLDDIDRVYALNILMMYHGRRSRRDGFESAWNEAMKLYDPEVEFYPLSDDYDPLTDPLTQKLRDVILNGRDPNWRDRRRGRIYNRAMKKAGLRFRAPTGRNPS